MYSALTSPLILFKIKKVTEFRIKIIHFSKNIYILGFIILLLLWKSRLWRKRWQQCTTITIVIFICNNWLCSCSNSLCTCLSRGLLRVRSIVKLGLLLLSWIWNSNIITKLLRLLSHLWIHGLLLLLLFKYLLLLLRCQRWLNR